MLLNFEEIKAGEINCVSGGVCKCNCDRGVNGTNPEVGKTKSPET
jgi:hypothetical protein